MGTFNGHAGVVWCLDVDWTSTRLVSGSGDATVRLWDVSNGMLPIINLLFREGAQPHFQAVFRQGLWFFLLRKFVLFCC